MISTEDFAIWRAQPITEAVMKHLADLRDGMKDRWLSISWEGGNADPVALAEARAMAAMATEILELTADDLNEEQE